MKNSTRFLASAVWLLLCLPGTTAFATDNDNSLEGLEFRLVGPWRGGRVTTVTGVRGQPNLYYMGATGGGVWKTENAGTTWENISDEFFKVGTIGAVAVAPSDPNVLYVGTGESPIRGVTTSHGDIEAEYVVNCAGMWARQLGAASGVNIPLQAAEHYYLITEKIAAMSAAWPVLEDPSSFGYYREEVGGLMIGLFEPVCAPWQVGGCPRTSRSGRCRPTGTAWPRTSRRP